MREVGWSAGRKQIKKRRGNGSSDPCVTVAWRLSEESREVGGLRCAQMEFFLSAVEDSAWISCSCSCLLLPPAGAGPFFAPAGPAVVENSLHELATRGTGRQILGTRSRSAGTGARPPLVLLSCPSA